MRLLSAFEPGSRCVAPDIAYTLAAIGLSLAAAVAQASEPPSIATSSQPTVERPLAAPAGQPLGGEELELATLALAKEMRCPVCQGSSIADSPSLSAQNMVAEVRQLLAEGYSAEQVLLYFEGRYGEFVRLSPKASGFNLVVWLLPLLGLALGAGLLARNLRSAGLQEPEPELETYRERVLQEESERESVREPHG